ncbi:PREDICTED: protein phosphatase 1 regulatory subunit 14D, partial [Merops nubicus]|uniref:protein phosphatase 1 regulatory subunit 14D n=1 Tax=Merops nubicus TaxID=57421 RepID=UPI0004F044EC
MASNSSTLPRVTFQTPEKPEEESSHRKLGKLTIKYNRKELQRWLDLEEWINTQLQELYQCR